MLQYLGESHTKLVSYLFIGQVASYIYITDEGIIKSRAKEVPKNYTLGSET